MVGHSLLKVLFHFSKYLLGSCSGELEALYTNFLSCATKLECVCVVLTLGEAQFEAYIPPVLSPQKVVSGQLGKRRMNLPVFRGIFQYMYYASYSPPPRREAMCSCIVLRANNI